MKRYDQMSSLNLLIFAISICIESGRLSFGSFHNPGPGFLPLLVGLLFRNILHRRLSAATLSDKPQEKFSTMVSSERWKKLIWVLVALFCLCDLFGTLGFLTSTFLLLVFLFRFGMEPKRWVVAIGGSAIASFLLRFFELC